MTLDQQVHQQELKIQKLEQKIRELEKNSHPPVDFIDRIVEAINSGKLKLEGIDKGFGRSSIESARRIYAL